MANNEFSLRIDCKEDGACVIFQNDSTICRYREDILNNLFYLGGTAHNEFEVSIPTRKQMDNFLMYLSVLKTSKIAITTNHGKETLCKFEQSNYIKSNWEKIKESAVFYGGTPTGEGFNFQKSSEGYAFALYLVHLQK